MRIKNIMISDKALQVKEMRIGEIKSLFEELMNEADELFKADKPSDAGAFIMGFLTDKLVKIFPGLTQDDIENAYPSEIEEAISAFIDVNFMGVKKAGAPFLKAITSAPTVKK